MATLLPAAGRYDGTRLLAFLGAHAVPGVESWDGTTYARGVTDPDGARGPVVVAVTAVTGGIAATVHEAGRAVPPAPGLVDRLRHLLALDADPADAELALAGDPLLDVGRRPGLRWPGSVDDGETLVRTVVGQQVSLAGARAVLGRVAAALGEPLAHPVAGVDRAFPAMADLAAADPLALPLTRARARSVVACAAAVADLGRLPDHDGLLALPGVGPWTADYVRLRCRHDPDVFLASDLAVRRVLESRGVDGTPRAAAARAAGWSPYRSTALMHLWTTYLEPAGPRAAAARGRNLPVTRLVQPGDGPRSARASSGPARGTEGGRRET